MKRNISLFAGVLALAVLPALAQQPAGAPAAAPGAETGPLGEDSCCHSVGIARLSGLHLSESASDSIKRACRPSKPAQEARAWPRAVQVRGR